MRKIIILAACMALLSACGSMQQAVNAYGGAAISSAQQANDSYALAWAAAACGTTVGAAFRNPQVIPALKVLCAPPADAGNLLDAAARPGRE